MTTDNLPAVREEVPTTALAPVASADTDSWVQVMRPLLNLAEQIADTEFVPRGLRGSKAATAAAMLYGREVGLAPMTALNMTHVVEGKPGLSAEGMRALVLAAGHEIEVVETNGAHCHMRGRRRGSDTWTPIVWTLDMARAANLLHKNNWRAHPRQMLQARATTELCRLVFPDVIHGFRSVEELEDMRDGDGEPTGFAEAPMATQRVRRAAKKTAAALPAATRPDADAAPAGPPLPGEPGHETSGGGAAPADRDVVSDGSEPSAPESELAAEPSDDGASTPTERAGTDSEDGSAAGEPAGGNEAADAVTPEETTGGDAGADARPASPRPASRAQERMIFAELSNKFGVDGDDREERLYLCGRVLRRELPSFAGEHGLSSQDAKHLIETFGRLKDRAALDALLDTIDQAEDDRAEVERQDLAGEPEQNGGE